MKVIKQSRWSLRWYSQIYECELPARCRDPIDLAALFFELRSGHKLKVRADSIRFSRGNWLHSLFSGRNVRQGVYIHLDAANHSLVCEYSLLTMFPIHAPPWPLQEEVQELEDWIKQQVSAGMVGSNGQRRRMSLASGHQGQVRKGSFIYRPLYWAYRFFSWLRYWIPRRFTKAGLVLIGVTFVALILGLDPENSVGYQGFTLAIGLLFLSMLFGFRFRAKFSAERRLPRFGTVGQAFTYRVAVQNLTKKNQDGLWLLENLRDIRPGFHEWTAVQVDDSKHVRAFRFGQRRRQNPFRLARIKEGAIPLMRSADEEEVTLEMTPLRRGFIHLAGVTVARPDPLGLFRALQRIALPQSVLILPKRYGLPPVALPGVLKYHQGGVALASNVGQSDEFVALREYRRGDPVRHIHWRSWAKTGKPIVKEFEDEFFVRHALILDTFTERPYTDEFEEAVSVAASFACTVLTQESLLDLLFVGSEAHCFTAGRGLAHADQMLEVLASVQPTMTNSFETLDELVVNHANVMSGCICVLLAWDEARQKLIEKLKAFGLPVLVLVIQSSGKANTLELGPMRDDPERLIALEVGKVEEQLAALK